MITKMQERPLTSNDILAAAARAFDDLHTEGWGQVFIMFMDEDRITQAIQYMPPTGETTDEEDDHALCIAEVQDAVQQGWRPVCLNILPYAEPIIVPLRENLSIDDQAFIWSLTEDEEDNATGLETNSGE